MYGILGYIGMVAILVGIVGLGMWLYKSRENYADQVVHTQVGNIAGPIVTTGYGTDEEESYLPSGTSEEDIIF